MDRSAPTVHEIVERSQWLRAFAQARLAVALALVGGCIFTTIDWDLGRPLYMLAMRMAHIFIAVAVLGLLVLRQRKLSLTGIVVSTLVVLLPLLPIFWFSVSLGVATGWTGGPFLGYRLVLLGAAMLVPRPLWVAGLVIAVFASSALLHYLMLAGSFVGVGEPWITGLHVLIAIGIVSLRAQLEALTQKFAQASTAAHSLRELARTVRFVKDGTGSPLQTITGVATLLRRKAADPAELADRIDRSARRIDRLMTTLDQYEDSGAEEETEAFDAELELDRQHAELLRRAHGLPVHASRWIGGSEATPRTPREDAG